MGTNVRVTKNGPLRWTWGSAGLKPEVRNLGYWEPESPPEMPAPGTCRPVPLREVTRPDFKHRGLDDVEFGEEPLPSDTAELWATFRALSPGLLKPGVGLFVARRVAEQHGGSLKLLQARPAPVFEIVLPRKAATSP